MLKLFFSPGACSFSPHIVLHELGLKHEVEKVDIKNKSAEWTKLNPKGYVPALMTDKGLLTEGPAIVQYLADQKPEANLIPKAGTWERYRAIEMLNFISTELHKGFSPIFGASRMMPTPEGAEALKNAAIQNIYKKYEVLTTMLGNNKFLMGDHFTVCDAYAFTVLNWTRMMKIDMSKFPKILGYMETMQARPSVQAALKMEASASPENAKA